MFFTVPPLRRRWQQRYSTLIRVLAVLVLSATSFGAVYRGLPFIRTYPLDEIGQVPRGLRLGFDEFGRIAVMYDGIYTVLNDSTWIERIDGSSDKAALTTTIRFIEGKYYYGGRGSWGTVDQTPGGKLRARSLVPDDAPSWTRVTPFNEVLGTKHGVYFFELNGLVFWNHKAQRNFFFELPRLTRAFKIADRVFVSCQDGKLREILPDASIRFVDTEGLDAVPVSRAVPLDDSHALIALNDNRLLVFDGRLAVPWDCQSRYNISGKISGLSALKEGGIAVAIDNRGLFLISADGSLNWELSSLEFQRITNIAANEPGVLWIAGQNAVHRLFYNSPITEFGQQLGLSVAWPKVVNWNGHVFVCSNQQVSVIDPVSQGRPARVRLLSASPEGGAGTIAASKNHLLMGNAKGVFSLDADEHFNLVTELENVHRIVFVTSDVCVVIASRQIAALRFQAGVWSECADRIDGVGDGPVTVLNRKAIWIELGADRIARLTFKNNRLSLERIKLPWAGGPWTNLGAIGDTIVISGARGFRTFFDENHESFSDPKALRQLLDRSPYWIGRVSEDSTGKLWAAHSKGVVTFTPSNGDYEINATTYELPNDSYPAITVLPEDDIWFTSGRSLYHVEQLKKYRDSSRAVLVSLVTDNLNRELLPATARKGSAPQIAFEDNSLSFRLFSGTYAWRYPPLYEYRLNENEKWDRVEPGLLLGFPKLRDGAYRLEVRAVTPDPATNALLTADFVINPPWFRTSPAYGCYALTLVLFIVLVVRWSNRRSIKNNEALQHLVSERTKQLESTMAKLREETRNTATLEERRRLAGEIHDSLGQGFHGLMLQLESVSTIAECPPKITNSLAVARGLIAQCRKEVRHAVWAMRSPLLSSVDLPTALKQIAHQTADDNRKVSVTVTGIPRELGASIEHNMLRIGQEAITNVVEHARASQLVVCLDYSAEFLKLVVEDNGCGFEERKSRTTDAIHFGLLSMHDRAKRMNGTLQIQSELGRGTKVVVIIPMSDAAMP